MIIIVLNTATLNLNFFPVLALYFCSTFHSFQKPFWIILSPLSLKQIHSIIGKCHPILGQLKLLSVNPWYLLCSYWWCRWQRSISILVYCNWALSAGCNIAWAPRCPMILNSQGGLLDGASIDWPFFWDTQLLKDGDNSIDLHEGCTTEIGSPLVWLKLVDW